ncbi:hypothetical protein QJQ45_021886 [Haematococcus lacustris]|nr:hypothetical protein QJQ45_021886 [Haematococcus lacustris]
MGLSSNSHPYRRKGGHAARCACCATCTPAGSTGWVEIHVEGEAAFYSSGRSHTAIGQVTAMMYKVIRACSNLEPRRVPLAHGACAEAAAAALAVGQQLRGQEPASHLQPMPRLCSTPTQAPAQPGPAQSQLQGSSQHHPALPALLRLPGLSILTGPDTNPVTSPRRNFSPQLPLPSLTHLPDADGSVMLTVRQYGKPSAAVGSRPAAAAGKAKVELLCMRMSLSDVVGMLSKQMPEYIKHHRLAHHQPQVFREHCEAVKASKDGKVVIS